MDSRKTEAPTLDLAAPRGGWLERLFKLRLHGTTVKTELIAGLTTAIGVGALLVAIGLVSFTYHVLVLDGRWSLGSTWRMTRWALAPPKPKPETPAMAWPL